MALRHRLRRAGARLHGKGNDQVRFELTYKALAPQLAGDRAVARVGHRLARRRHRVRAQAQRADFAHRPPRSTAATATSGTSRTKAARWKIRPTPRRTRSGCSPRVPSEAPDKAGEVTIGFEKGVPVSVDGKTMKRVRAARSAEPDRRRARHRAHRPGGEPLRRDEVARLLRNAGRRADHVRACANWKRSRSTRTRCTTSRSWRSITRRWSTTACGSRRCARRWMRSSKR